MSGHGAFILAQQPRFNAFLLHHHHYHHHRHQQHLLSRPRHPSQPVPNRLLLWLWLFLSSQYPICLSGHGYGSGHVPGHHKHLLRHACPMSSTSPILQPISVWLLNINTAYFFFSFFLIVVFSIVTTITMVSRRWINHSAFLSSPTGAITQVSHFTLISTPPQNNVKI